MIILALAVYAKVILCLAPVHKDVFKKGNNLLNGDIARNFFVSVVSTCCVLTM